MTKRVFVAGHNGMVGRAIIRHLQQSEQHEIITRNRSDLDLTNQGAVAEFFRTQQIDQIYLAAAKVGGIYANNEYPAEFIYENLMVEANIIHASHQSDIQELLFLGSSCIYPRLATQPMQEEALLTGPLEPTNEPYGIAKIAGIKLCESYNRQYKRDYRSAMPTNLYGPHDNFHAENSHVIPAMLRRFEAAAAAQDNQVLIWGSGRPTREFLHVDDMASACVHLLNLGADIYASQTEPMRSHINVGTGQECSILELAKIIAKTTGFEGVIGLDSSKPDGAPRKLLDITRVTALGWHPQINLKTGLKTTYQWFRENRATLRA